LNEFERFRKLIEEFSELLDSRVNDEPKKILPQETSDNKMKKFESGTVVVFDPSNLNPEFWAQLSEEDRIKYYGSLGYGSEKQHHFVFICEIKNAPGHCVLISLQDQHVETMTHITDFREVNEDEF